MHNLSNYEVKQLAAKCLNGTISAHEQLLLDEWYRQQPESAPHWPTDETEESLQDRIFAGIAAEQKSKTRLLSSMLVKAAAAVLLFGAGIWAYHNYTCCKVEQNTFVKLKQQHNYTPQGKPEVLLTMADGSKMVLNHSGVFKHGSTTVKERNNSAYIYDATGAAGNSNAMNTVSVPARMKFNITLADGSKVWLNALSSLKFPAVFGKSNRIVELDGEAYFEVAKDSKRPFTVNTVKGTSVKVFGTHFNVMAYNDEDAVATTLLEGSVKVDHGAEHRTLVPGQLAMVKNGINISEVDVQQAVAWKNDLFCFNNTDTREVMRKIGRWYGVTIVFNKSMSQHELTGYVSHNAKLPDVLRMLELSGLSFAVENNKIEVLN